MDSDQKPIQQQPLDDQQALDEEQQAINELRENDAKTPEDHEYLDRVQREEIDVVKDDSNLPPSDLAPQVPQAPQSRTYRVDPNGVFIMPGEEDDDSGPAEYGQGGPRA